jgi:hypothetical protein
MSGAENEVRTRDPQLGKLVLYQLSYSRLLVGEIGEDQAFMVTLGLGVVSGRGDWI